jgi:hypothetical protein
MFPNRFELYNLHDDLGETNNLASMHPDKVAELDAQIDGFLKNTGALYPRPNPAYVPAAAMAGKKPADPLEGWVPRQCQAKIADGVMRIEGPGPSPFLGNAQVKHSGPVIVQLRVRSAAGGAGKIHWRTADQETFPANGQLAAFDIQPGEAWQDLVVELPVAGPLVHFRLYLPADKSTVELDRFQVLAANSHAVVRDWTFDVVPQGR